jgi:hypothetical protein
MATVRLFAHAGLSHAFVANYSQQQAYHALTMFKQPYMARQKLSPSTSVVADSTADTLGVAGARVLNVQVNPGERVHYEVTPQGQTLRVPDSSSPIMEGNEVIDWGTGWRISFLEVTP